MSSPTQTQTQPQDTPLTVTPSPANMPGAAAAQLHMNAPQQTMQPPKEMPVLPSQQGDKTPAKTDDKKPEGEPVDVKALQDRASGLQELARKFEQTAKDNESDANAFRKLQEVLGGVGEESAKVDPIAEIAKLRSDIESERTERLRTEISRLTGVPPVLITGADADSMSASAQSALEWGQGLGQKQTGVPLVAPATTVTSADKPGSGRPQQIQTRDELKGMSSKAIMEAYNGGQLDHLLGRPT